MSTSKMPVKRPAPVRKSGRAKKSKGERERYEQGCDCGDNHESLLECEIENLKLREETKVE